MVMPQPANSELDKILSTARKLREKDRRNTPEEEETLEAASKLREKERSNILRDILSKHFDVSPDEPYFLSSQQAQSFGFEVPQDWKLKAFKEETDGGYAINFSEVTPSGWEVSGEDTIVSPEGQRLTIEETREMEETFPEWGSFWETQPAPAPTTAVAGTAPPLGFVWDYETGKYFPATLDLEVTKRFYQENPGLLPEGVSPTLTQDDVDILMAREEETYAAFVNVFPEMMSIEGGDYQTDIRETITQIYENEEVQAWFTDTLKEKGRTPETERLLRSMSPQSTEAELREFFGAAKVDKTPWERAWKSLYVGIRTGATQAAQAVFNVILPSMFPYVQEGQSKVTGVSDAQAQGIEGYAYTAEEAIIANQQMEPWRAKFRQVAVNLQSQHEDWVKKHPEYEPPPEYEQDIFENPELLKDPGWLIHTMAQTTGMMLPSLAAGLAVTFTTKQPILGTLTMAATMTPMEMQGLYDDLVQYGAPIERAEELALIVGAAIGAVEIAPGMIFMKAVYPVFKPFRRGLQTAVVKATMRHMIAKGVKNFTAIEVSEALEEVLQGVIADYTVSFYDENRDILAAIPSTVLKTLVGVFPMAIFGGGMSMRRVPPDVAETVPDSQKEIEGWEKNRFTGQWQKPEKMVDSFNEIVDEGKVEGLTDNQAKLQAFNELAATPEGEFLINKASESIVNTGRPAIPPVTPEPAEAPPVVEKPPVVKPEVTVLSPAQQDIVRIGRMSKSEFYEYYKGATPKIDSGLVDFARDMTDAEVNAFYSAPSSETIAIVGKNYYKHTVVSKRAEIENFRLGAIDQAVKPTAIAEEITAIPKAEPGMPEAGYQPAMIEGVTEKEVRPVGKGKIVQISMEDQLKLDEARRAAEEAGEEVREAYEAQVELEVLRETLENDPIASLRFDIGLRAVGKGEKRKVISKMVSIDQLVDAKENEFAYNDSFTPAQARAIKPDTVFSEVNKLKNGRIRADAVLDDLAQKYTDGDVNEFINRVNQIRDAKRQAKEAKKAIKKNMTERPLETLPEQAEVSTSPVGEQMLTEGQVSTTLDLFGKYIESRSAVDAWELTRELRREERSERAEDLKIRAQQLIVEEGMNTEEAMNQSIRETMSGELPKLDTDYLSDLTGNMRQALFDKVYYTLKDESYEMMSTVTALTNALAGNPISREPGVKGGSAYSRLQRVFGDQPVVMKSIETISENKESLEDVVEGIFHEIGREPIPVDQETADYLRTVGKEKKTREEVAIIRKYHRAHPAKKYDAPIDKAFKQPPMFNFMEQSMLNRVLKELLWSPIDIGNFLRANKASFDNSFLRQSKMLAGGHPFVGWQGHATAWQSMFSQKHAEAEWELITRDPDFQIYEEDRIKTGHDPLRVPAFAGDKGTERYRYSEEMGFTSQHVERLIPKFTAWLPHVKYSERAFSAGTNKIAWGVWKQELMSARREAEKIASGKAKLKEGESFDIIQEMSDFQGMLGDLIQRANLRQFSGLAPAMNAFFFAARSKVGRFLFPKHLIGMTIHNGKVGFNPRVMKEAWRDFIATNAQIAGLMFLGAWLGLWDLETDPRNAEVMSARIGKTRIDPWAGYRQFAVLYARLCTGTGISSVTGAEYDIDPVGTTQSFFEYSLSPLAGTLLEFWTGRNFLGQVVDYDDAKYWIEKITPFAINDVWEAYEGEGWGGAKLAVVPAFYGEGVQTYTGTWEDNFKKLGISKFPENLEQGVPEPYYDMTDLWSDNIVHFKGVDPATLTERKGFPNYIRLGVETLIINEHIDSLPSDKLVEINTDPDKGLTFVDYYDQWEQREKLVAAGDDAEWTVSKLQPDGTYKEVTHKGDKAISAYDNNEITQNANRGNFSQRQLALLYQYWTITDKKEQADFLDKHKADIGTNARKEYLRTHAKENAMLALWGQANSLYSRESYDEFNKLLKEYDIPDTAIPELILPPEGSVEASFKRLELVAEGREGSPEGQLLLLLDHLKAQEAEVESLAGWKNLQVSDKTVEYWQLRADNQGLYDKLDEIDANEKLDNKVKDKNGLTEKERAIAEVKATKVGDETFGDIENRVVAIGKGTRDNPIPDETVNLFVEHKRIGDESGGSSLEVKLNRYDNPSLNDFLMSEDYWGATAAEPLYGEYDQDYLDRWLVPRWRLEVKHRGDTAQYKAILKKYTGTEEDEQRRGFLYKNGQPTEYCLAYYQIKAYQKKIPVEYQRDYITWYTDLKLKEKPDYYPDNVAYYEDDWFLMSHEGFYQDVYLGILHNEERKFDNVPTKKVLNQYISYLDLDKGKERADYRHENKEFDDWLLLTGKVSISIDEKRRRTNLTPAEKREEDWQDILDKLKR